MDVEIPVGQRTPDETFVRRAATVTTVDEALTWVARQLDTLSIAEQTVSFECAPVTGYVDDQPDVLITWFEVAVGGTVIPEDDDDHSR